ncbi:DNA polymerase IV [Patescibacteria group bacterium]|nr:DNA polymerase IV [Patescibacteria group bacterium]
MFDNISNENKKAILHIDGDCFFVSCERALNPSLNNKAVVTGKERKIASALSYEAKALGVRRGMSINEIKRLYPQTIILDSNYDVYINFAKRMYEILRRYSSEVEQYSIDECFVDLSGLDKCFKLSYNDLVIKIKQELERELNLSFSAGLSYNKSLAKIASNWNKPAGFVNINISNLKYYLSKLKVENIWGIGPSSVKVFHRYKINIALEFVNKKEDFIKNNFQKPYYEIYQELKTKYIYKLKTSSKKTFQSISKSETFNKNSSDENFIFSQFSINIEKACAKARRYKLEATSVLFYLKIADFKYEKININLENHTNIDIEIIKVLAENFKRIFSPYLKYRATGITLKNLKEMSGRQSDIFYNHLQTQKLNNLYFACDKIHKNYGNNSIYLASSMNSGVDYKLMNKDKKNNSIPYIALVD